LRCAVASLAAVVLAVTTTVGLPGQQKVATVTTSLTTASHPALAAMVQATCQQDYTIEQLRRFRSPKGKVTTVRELLEVNANGTLKPQFRLTMLSVIGEPPGSPVETEWRRNYARFGDTLFRHGSFHVRDLLKASANYTVHSFGAVTIANRSAQCLVVYPNYGGRAIWVVYVDAQAGIPLYVAEFDDNLRLFAEIEALNFSPVAPQLSAVPTQATSQITSQAVGSFHAAAAQFVTGGAKLVDPATSTMPSFSLGGVEVRTDSLNGRQKLLMSYTDGIDEFIVEQSPGSQDPFQGLPSQAGGAHTIARFHDATLDAMVFFDDSVVFHVSGRGSLGGLDRVAQDILRQALAQ